MASVLASSETGAVVVPGKPDESRLYQMVHDGKMPPGGKIRLSDGDLAAIRKRGGQYLVGTPRSQMKQFEAELSKNDWTQVRPEVEVKMVAIPQGEETYILCRTSGRKEKEKAIRNRFSSSMEKALRILDAAHYIVAAERFEVNGAKTRIYRDSGRQIVTGLVVNDVVSIGDGKVVEGNAGGRNLVFPVRLATTSGAPVTVDYSTADGTAQSTAPADYLAHAERGPAGGPCEVVRVPLAGVRGTLDRGLSK